MRSTTSPEPGDHDDADVVVLAQVAGKPQAVLARQAQVQQHDIGHDRARSRHASASPSAASATLKPCEPRYSASISRIARSSSTTSMHPASATPFSRASRAIPSAAHARASIAMRRVTKCIPNDAAAVHRSGNAPGLVCRANGDRRGRRRSTPAARVKMQEANAVLIATIHDMLRHRPRHRVAMRAVIEASKRVRWDIDADVIRGRDFDFSQTFLPAGAVEGRRTRVPVRRRAPPAEPGARPHLRVHLRPRRTVHRRQGPGARPDSTGWATRWRSRRSVRFSDEELKHQELFRRIEAMLERRHAAGLSSRWPQPNDGGACRARQVRPGRCWR